MEFDFYKTYMQIRKMLKMKMPLNIILENNA